MQDAVIVAARRTPIGKLNGALASLSAAQMGGAVIKSVVEASGIDPALVEEVIMGQVLTGGAGQNPARQSAIGAGLPVEVPAMTVNKVCGAGQKSIHLAAQAIRLGDAGIVVAGGQDSMSRAPHLLYGAREGIKMGVEAVKDSMVLDGLWDAFHDVHMGATVENIVRRYGISREEQDAFAAHSQRKAVAAQQVGRFGAEITPVTVVNRRSEETIATDEHPNPDTTVEKLGKLRPVFDADGSITAGNSSGLNDGAAAVLVMSAERAKALGLEPMARIASYACKAIAPMDMGLAPVHASRAALEKAGWTTGDLDLMEINEAFAAQAMAVNRDMEWDTDRINVNGGAIALGHPLAGSGCRIVVTLIHEMLKRDAKKGLASLCIGGGQAVAICLER
jgi:acetyl-CoA C-acetyltransferase